MLCNMDRITSVLDCKDVRIDSYGNYQELDDNIGLKVFDGVSTYCNRNRRFVNDDIHRFSYVFDGDQGLRLDTRLGLEVGNMEDILDYNIVPDGYSLDEGNGNMIFKVIILLVNYLYLGLGVYNLKI